MNIKKSGRGPNISNTVRQLIISQAIHDSKTMPRRALAVRLQELIERMGEPPPTEDTLVKMISEARNKQPGELEKPWCIGVCAYYNIPPDIIPLLIKVQQSRKQGEFKDFEKELTIREALWYNRLRPVVETLTKNKFPFDVNAPFSYLNIIVSAYVQRERVSEIMNEQYPNTTDLDRIIFINEDLSNDGLFQVWWSMRSEQEREDMANIIEKKRKSAIEKLEQGHEDKPNSIDSETVNDFFNAAINGPVALREWKNQHPDMDELKELGFYWMEIFIEAMEGTNNER